MISPSSRSCRSCCLPHSSRACPSRRRGPRSSPWPPQPGRSSGSRSPCRHSRDGGRSRAALRRATRAGSRPLRTPVRAPSQAAPRTPETARSSNGSAPLSAPEPDASPRSPPRSPPAARSAGALWKGSASNPANLKQSRVATQLPQQRLDRGMLEHAACDQRAPHRPHRVVVAPPAPTGLKSSHDFLVGKGCRAPAAAAQGRAGFRHCSRKRVASPLSPSRSPNQGWWMERGPQARWRHFLSDSGETTWPGWSEPGSAAGHGVKIVQPPYLGTSGPQISAKGLG